MIRKKLNIGLFGFGCVGKGLYEVLQKTPALKTQIKKICVKDKTKARTIANEHFTFCKEDILEDDSIQVVVELIDDADAAFEIVKEALSKRKAVVSANKKMIAEHFTELLELQNKYGVPLLYEAACCASIPIIRNLEEYYDTDLLESIEGIVNGSTNYILSSLNKEGSSYAKALIEAQEKGYAESDPLLDTGGFDAKYKLVLLVAHAFGLVLKPENILNIGIDELGETELRYAREKGYKIKLIAQAEKDNEGSISAFVFPKFIHQEDRFYSVDDVFNAVKTKSCFSDVQFFTGKGAGAHPTASAVLSDLSALSYDYRYEYKKLQGECYQEKEDSVFVKVFLRFDPKLYNKVRYAFVEIEEKQETPQSAYVIGVITLKEIKKLKARYSNQCSFVLFNLLPRQSALFIRREPEIELRDVFI